VGENHSLGLKADGSIVAWGASSGRQYNIPLPNSGFVTVAGGHDHSLGLFGVNFFDLSAFASQWAQTYAPTIKIFIRL